jgi:hypothetical protein
MNTIPNTNINNYAIKTFSNKDQSESQSKLMEIKNITMNSNYNTDRKGSENFLNNKQQYENSKNFNETNKSKVFIFI